MTTEEKRLALVIGNGAYINLAPLKNPTNDAEVMAKILLRLGFEVISGIDLGRDAMEDQLANFKAIIGKASAAMVFYAGHGVQVKGHNYLIPVDADIQEEFQLKRRAFALDEMLESMVQGAHTSLIFLDACRDNPISRHLRSGMSDSEQQRRLVRSGLAEVKASQGSFIAFATAPNTVAHDGKGANSPFTEALVRHIEKPGASISDMMIAVRNDVLKMTSGRQRPWDQSSLTGQFYFQPLAVDAGVASALPAYNSVAAVDTDKIERSHWLNIQGSLNPGAFEGFLASFPDSENAERAKSRAEDRIKNCRDPEILEWMLRDYPNSERGVLATQKLEELNWSLAKTWSISNVESFLKRWPEGQLAETARGTLDKLRREASPRQKAKSFALIILLLGGLLALAGFLDYLGRNSPDRLLVRQDDEAFETAQTEGAKAVLEDYLATYRRHANEALVMLRALDLAAYSAAENSKTRESYERYRREWPSGQYFFRAGEQIKKLDAGG